jgi:hypothetical protein
MVPLADLPRFLFVEREGRAAQKRRANEQSSGTEAARLIEGVTVGSTPRSDARF